MTPAEFGKFIADETEKWGKVIRAASISLSKLGRRRADIPTAVSRTRPMTIPQGGSILKYGQVIWGASRPLKAGEHAHVHNIESARLTRDLARAMTT